MKETCWGGGGADDEACRGKYHIINHQIEDRVALDRGIGNGVKVVALCHDGSAPNREEATRTSFQHGISTPSSRSRSLSKPNQ